jgi:hypothetical protein
MSHDTKIYLYKMCINSKQSSKTENRVITMADSNVKYQQHSYINVNNGAYSDSSVKPKHYTQHLLPFVDAFVGYHKISMIMIASTIFLPLYQGCIVSIYWIMSTFALFCNSRKETNICFTNSRALSK